MRLRGLHARIAEATSRIGAARHERNHAGLHKIDIVIRREIGKERERILPRIHAIRAERKRATGNLARYSMDIALDTVNVLSLTFLQTHQRMREFRARLETPFARRR